MRDQYGSQIQIATVDRITQTLLLLPINRRPTVMGGEA